MEDYRINIKRHFAFICECRKLDENLKALYSDCDSLWSVNDETWDARARSIQLVKFKKIQLQAVEDDFVLQKRIHKETSDVREGHSLKKQARWSCFFSLSMCGALRCVREVSQNEMNPGAEGPVALAEMKKVCVESEYIRAVDGSSEFVNAAPNMLSAALRAEEQARLQFAGALRVLVESSLPPTPGNLSAELCTEWANTIVEMASLDSVWSERISQQDLEWLRSEMAQCWLHRLKQCELPVDLTAIPDMDINVDIGCQTNVKALRGVGAGAAAVVKALQSDYDAKLVTLRQHRRDLDTARIELELAQQLKLEADDSLDSLIAKLEVLESREASLLSMDERLFTHGEITEVRVEMSAANAALVQAERRILTIQFAVNELRSQHNEALGHCIAAASCLKNAENRFKRQLERAIYRRDLTRKIILASFPDARLAGIYIDTDSNVKEESLEQQKSSRCYELTVEHDVLVAAETSDHVIENAALLKNIPVHRADRAGDDGVIEGGNSGLEIEMADGGLAPSDLEISEVCLNASNGVPAAGIVITMVSAVDEQLEPIRQVADHIRQASEHALSSYDKAKFSVFFDADDASVHWKETEKSSKLVLCLCTELLEMCRRMLKDHVSGARGTRLLQTQLLLYIDNAESDRQRWVQQLSPASIRKLLPRLDTPVSIDTAAARVLEAEIVGAENKAKEAHRRAESQLSVGDVAMCYAVWDDAILRAREAESAYKRHAVHLRATIKAADAIYVCNSGAVAAGSVCGSESVDGLKETLSESLCLQVMWCSKKAWFEACKAVCLAHSATFNITSTTGTTNTDNSDSVAPLHDEDNTIETRIRNREATTSSAQQAEVAWKSVCHEYRYRRQWGVHPDSLNPWFDRAIEDAVDNCRRWSAKVLLQEAQTIQMITEYQAIQLTARLQSKASIADSKKKNAPNDKTTPGNSNNNDANGPIAAASVRTARAQSCEMQHLSDYATAIAHSRSHPNGEYYRKVVYTDAPETDDSPDEEEEEEEEEEGREEECGENTSAASSETQPQAVPETAVIVSTEQVLESKLESVLVSPSAAATSSSKVVATKVLLEEERQLDMVYKSMKETNSAYESTMLALEKGLSLAPESHKQDWLADIEAARNNRLASDHQSRQARSSLERSMLARGVSMVSVRCHPDYKQYVDLIEVGATVSLVKEKLIASGSNLQPDYLDDLDRLVVYHKKSKRGLRGKFKKWLSKSPQSK